MASPDTINGTWCSAYKVWACPQLPRSPGPPVSAVTTRGACASPLLAWYAWRSSTYAMDSSYWASWCAFCSSVRGFFLCGVVPELSVRFAGALSNLVSKGAADHSRSAHHKNAGTGRKAFLRAAQSFWPHRSRRRNITFRFCFLGLNAVIIKEIESTVKAELSRHIQCRNRSTSGIASLLHGLGQNRH